MSIYLDYNATAPLRPAVIAVMMDVLSNGPGNASSIHGFGRAAKKTVEDARAHLAALINVDTQQIIFNSGATEGNNTVLRFYGASPARILVSATEHPSVLMAAQAMNAEIIPVHANGMVDLDAFEKMCASSPAPALVSVMLVNNETGVINPVADVARIAHACGAAVHVDAVQALGKIPIDFAALGADFMTLSAHKCGGPQGIGALVIGNGDTGTCLPPPVLLLGGGQERSLRAGTENIACIAGFGALARELRDAPAVPSFQTEIEDILRAVRNDTVIFGADAPRVSNTVCFAVPGMDAQTILMKLDLMGVAVSSGSACSSGKVRDSHVLSAMNMAPSIRRGAIRISTGWATTSDEIQEFGRIWQNLTEN